MTLIICWDHKMINTVTLTVLLVGILRHESAGARAEDHFAVLPERRIMACCVDGAHGEVLRDVLCSLSRHHAPYADLVHSKESSFEEGCDRNSMTASKQGLHFPEDMATIIASSHWHKVAFIDDPLSRLFNAWLRLCAPEKISRVRSSFTHSRPRWAPGDCVKVFGSPTVSFARAVQSLWKTLAAGGVGVRASKSNESFIVGSLRGPTAGNIREDPWRLQSDFCNGTLRRSTMRYSSQHPRSSGFIAIQHSQSIQASRAAVKQVLMAAGVAVPETEPAFRFHFRSETEHGVEKAASLPGGVQYSRGFHRMLWNHYSPSIARLALLVYALDYKTLRLTIPPWVLRSVGIDFVRRLGLSFTPIERTNSAPPTSMWEEATEAEANRAGLKNELRWAGQDPQPFLGAVAFQQETTPPKKEAGALMFHKNKKTRAERRKEEARRRSFVRSRAARYRCAISNDPAHDPECREAKVEHVRSARFGNF